MKETWMKPATRLLPLLIGSLMLSTAVPARAGLLDSLFGGGSSSNAPKGPTGQKLWVVRDFSEVRIVAREAGSQPNQHPAQLNPDLLRQQLVQLRFDAGGTSRPLLASDEAAELVQPLIEALAGAGPGDDVLLLSSARRGDAVMMRPVAVTARLFVQGGALQFIVNDARYEFYDTMRGTNRAPEFTYGSRTRPGSASLRAEGASVVRADWLALPLSAAAAAAAPAVAAPAAAAPTAAPAPAAAPAAAAPAVPLLRPRDPGFADEVEQRLTTLKRLRDRGLISEEEYQQKRKEILQQL